MASSQIEGITPSPQQVALAELSHHEKVRGFGDEARLVANNITVVDLLGYLNGSLHGPLVQAALVHAQFETIHPFSDGNGRVGRALIHTVLVRRGLTPAAVLPVSMVLRTLSDQYVQGLSAYRYDGGADSEPATAGTTDWLRIFVEACSVAAERAQTFVDDIAELRADWSERIAAHRVRQGIRQAPRVDSATFRRLAVLPEAPLMTARSAERLLGISQTRARDGLEEIAAAGVLARKTVDRGVTGYSATEVFDLITTEERRLAGTRFDTRLAPPAHGVPARPQQS